MVMFYCISTGDWERPQHPTEHYCCTTCLIPMLGLIKSYGHSERQIRCNLQLDLKVRLTHDELFILFSALTFATGLFFLLDNQR